MTIDVFLSAPWGTLPVLIVWIVGKREWLAFAILTAMAISVTVGDPLYSIVDLTLIVTIGSLAYGDLYETYDRRGKDNV